MAKLLGADINYHKPYFLNPYSNEKVYIILDPCHMLKLVRNTLGEIGIVSDGFGNQIRWDHIVELSKIQTKYGLHVANKIRKKHINFQNEKMKVNLAAQVLSNST